MIPLVNQGEKDEHHLVEINAAPVAMHLDIIDLIQKRHSVIKHFQ